MSATGTSSTRASPWPRQRGALPTPGASSQRLAIRLGVTVATYPLEVLLIKATPEPTSLLALCAASLKWARVAGGGLGSVPDGSLLVVVAFPVQGLALGADVEVSEVSFSIVNKFVLAKEGTAFVVFGQHHVGVDAGLLHGRYVLDGAVGCIAGDRVWPQAPTKTALEEQI